MMRWSRWLVFAVGGKLRKTPQQLRLDGLFALNPRGERRYIYTYPVGDSARSGRDLRARRGGSYPVMEYGAGASQPDTSAEVVRPTGQHQSAPKVH